MRYNLPVRRPAFAQVARLLGEDVAGLGEEEAAERAVAAVERLRADVGIPGRLRVTVGTTAECDTFLAALREIL
jgi:1,3-propanediol dehydrogenase